MLYFLVFGFDILETIFWLIKMENKNMFENNEILNTLFSFLSDYFSTSSELYYQKVNGCDKLW